MYLFLQLDCLFHSPEFLNQSIKMNHKGDILRLAADNLSKAVHQVSRHGCDCCHYDVIGKHKWWGLPIVFKYSVSQYKSLMIRLIWVFILVKLLTCVIRHINRLVNWALKALHHIRLHRSTFFLYLSTLSNIQSPSLMGGSGGRLFH